MINEKTLEENLQSIKARIEQAALACHRDPSTITIVGATKTVSVETLRAAATFGIGTFGENYVQEAKNKKGILAKLEVNPAWHMIGHLQKNKVVEAIELFDVIETVDSVPLAEAIARKVAKQPMPIMLQVNITGETSKFGFVPKEVINVYKTLKNLPQLSITGLMTIAPVVSNPQEARPFFRHLRQLRDELGLTELSMGMTDDFEVAIQEGATIVRIGRALFGQREQLF